MVREGVQGVKARLIARESALFEKLQSLPENDPARAQVQKDLESVSNAIAELAEKK